MALRASGETLAMRDSVAMMPTTQPAVAGTHDNREEGRVLVTVISREDKRSGREMALVDSPGVLLTRPCPGFVRHRAVFAERELQAAYTVAQRAGVRAQVFRRRPHQAGER